jgi:hypothetical protein
MSLVNKRFCLTAGAHPPKVEPFHVEPMTPARAQAILSAVTRTDLEVPVGLALWTGLLRGNCSASDGRT